MCPKRKTLRVERAFEVAVSCCSTTEREGFEPSKAARPYRFSRPAPSTTRTPLPATHNRGMGNLFPGLLCRTFWLRSSLMIYGTRTFYIGAGRIGQAVARRALGFGMSILIYGPIPATRFRGRSCEGSDRGQRHPANRAAMANLAARNVVLAGDTPITPVPR